jgi:hypothetical protein
VFSENNITMEEFERLLKLALSDGILTENERGLLLNKASSLGIDPLEAELMIENALTQLGNSAPVTNKDGYDISDDVLLQRIQKWVEYCIKDGEKVIVEQFPKLKSEINKLGNAIAAGQKAVGQIKDAGIVDAAANAAGVIPGAGFITRKIGGAAFNGILGAISDTKEVKMSNEQIVALTKQYLLILERRKEGDEFLSKKYDSLYAEMQNNVSLFNERKSKKKWF